MASEQHNFIVSAIARKMKLDGFRIIYLDGRYQDVEIEKPDIPPKVISHRPDLIGAKSGTFFCIGEAKTKNDLRSERTKNQLMDFLTIVKLNPENKLLIGIPLAAKEDLEKLLLKLGLVNQKQMRVVCIPDELLPHEEEF